MQTLAALYHFAPLPEPAARKTGLLGLMRAQGVTGTLILAREGVNGTIACTRAGLDAVLSHLRGWPGFAGLRSKESPAEAKPFQRSKVKDRAEIVTHGLAQGTARMCAACGKPHLAPTCPNCSVPDTS